MSADVSSPSDPVDELTKQRDHYKKRCEQYRELVRRLATSKNKNEAWYISKAWCPFWRELAFDLPSEAEQKAFLFD